MSNVWLNIDIPTKTNTIHFKIKPPKANFKGIGELKRDGGWFKFACEEEAVKYAKSNYPDFNLINASK